MFIKKWFWFIVMMICIPIDIILWNIIMGSSFGFRSPKQCVNDNWNLWVKEYCI
jgi:hypothetical protein